MEGEKTVITGIPQHIADVCGYDSDSKYIMTTVGVSKRSASKNGAWLHTTDGHMAVVVEAFIDGPVPEDGIPKAVLGSSDSHMVERDGRWFGPNNTWSPIDRHPQPMPPIKDVLPDADGDDVTVIALDAGKLLSLARALDAASDEVCLILHNDDPETNERPDGRKSCFLVVALNTNSSEGAGALMGCARDAARVIDRYESVRNAYVKDHEKPSTPAT